MSRIVTNVAVRSDGLQKVAGCLLSVHGSLATLGSTDRSEAAAGTNSSAPAVVPVAPLNLTPALPVFQAEASADAMVSYGAC